MADMARTNLPIPQRSHVGLITYDAAVRDFVPPRQGVEGTPERVIGVE